MRTYMKIFGLMSLLLMFCIACEKQNEAEALMIQKPFEKTAEYYENLRAYKRSNHPIICGWFKHWSGKGPNRVNYLDGLPDSLDMVFIGWGGWQNMDEARAKDMRYVQEKKGTRVLISFVITDIGQNVTPLEYNVDKATREEFWGWKNGDPSTYEPAIRKYANAICDSVYDKGYDGFDLDYEPHFGGSGNLASYNDRMAILVEELGKRLGPASGTGKLLVIDGETLDPSIADRTTKHFNFFVQQSYQANSSASLDSNDSWLYAKKAKFRPDQYVPAVNYEKWESGGGNFTDRIHGDVPAILGFAYWNPVDGRKGGVGALNIENDAKHDINYKYVRQAIQIMNPAVQ